MKCPLAVFLAALIASPATAARYAGSEAARPKTRVRGINLAAHPCVGAFSAASPECVWGISRVGLGVAAASTEYPLLDALNSVMAITDASGQVVREYQYDVYGARMSSTGSGPDVDRGFTGRYHDANGLIEHRDRQRNPLTGNWLQADRARFVDGPNFYLYAAARPVQGMDATGLATIYLHGGERLKWAVERELWNTITGYSLWAQTLSIRGEIHISEVVKPTARDHSAGSVGRAKDILGQTALFIGGIEKCASGTRVGIEISFANLDAHNKKERHIHSDAEILAHEFGHLVAFAWLGLEALRSAFSFPENDSVVSRYAAYSAYFSSHYGLQLRWEIGQPVDVGNDIAEEFKK